MGECLQGQVYRDAFFELCRSEEENVLSVVCSALQKSKLCQMVSTGIAKTEFSQHCFTT